MTGGVVLAFYATYFAYRNLKSIVPLLRDELFDRRLGDIDRSVFGGQRPGPGPARPARHGHLRARSCRSSTACSSCSCRSSLALALVVPRDPRPGLFFVTALSLNWVLAAGSYFLLPSLGPVYAAAGELRGSAVDRRQPPADGAAQPAHRVPARPGGRRRGAEHRRVRVAARLDLLHRRARDPPARRPAARVRGGLGAAGADRPGHALLRLALRARRRRRHGSSRSPRSRWRGR